MAGNVGLSHVTEAPATGPSYAAFISYSHTDEDVGDWLHRRLEAYRVPPSLVGRKGPNGAIGARLGKVFRDRVELSAAHDLGAEIREGLERSGALIVLCSPRSCGSRYVAEEIRIFKSLGKADRIFAAIVDGEPHAAGKPGWTTADECFPPALIYRFDENGALSSLPEANEPIAADFRNGKDGRENGSLKLIAGLLEVGLDDLVQRERQAEQQRRMRANFIAAGMSILALISIVSSLYGWSQGQSARNALVRAFAERADPNNALLSARHMLAAMREAPANEELYRGRLGAILFDWNEARLLSEGDFVDVDWSADGARLLTTTSEGRARLWDARTLHPIAQLQAGVVPRSATFSADGAQIVGGSTGGATVWNASDGQVAFRLPHKYLVQRARFAAANTRLLTWDGQTARVWDTIGRREILALSELDGAAINDAVIAPDGARVAVASATRLGVHMLGVATPILLRPTGEMMLSTILGIGFSPDGTTVYAFNNGGMQLWRSDDGTPIRHVPVRPDIDGVAFDTDGHRFYISNQGTVQAWTNTSDEDAIEYGDPIQFPVGDSKTMRIVTGWPRLIVLADNRLFVREDGDAVYSLQEFGARIQAAAVSPDGEQVLLASNRSARIQRTNGRTLWRVHGRDGPRISSFSLSSGGERSLTVSDHGAVSVRDNVGRALWHITPRATDAAFAGKVVVVAVNDELHLYDRETGRHRETLTQSPFLANHVGRISSVIVEDETALVRGDGGVGLWKLTGGGALLSLQKGLSRAVFGPDREHIATIDERGKLSVWDRLLQSRLISLDNRPVRGVAFSPLGDVLAVSFAGGGIGFWNYRTNDLVELPAGEQNVLVFSDDETRLFSGGQDGSITVWNVTTREVIKRIQTGDASIEAVAMDPSGTRLFVLLAGQVRVLDVRRLTQPMSELVAVTCAELLLRSDRRFSAAERDADPLIELAFTKGHNERDVCEDQTIAQPVRSIEERR